ncbi:HAD-IB family hydrolase [Litorivicinus sp.]|nr:HAD-IB family hydrolase [Litorivicinus sp.]
MQLAIFDLDHTLLPFDSDKSWNQFLIDQGVVSTKYYQEANERFYQDYLNASLDIRAYQRFACEILQKNGLETVTLWRTEYMKKIVEPQIQRKACECIANYKEKGFLTLIISATNTFILEPIALLHAVDAYLGCEFEVLNGKYTGELVGVPTYKAGKVKALESWLKKKQISPTAIHFFSDSINDRALLEHADQSFVVNPDKSLAQLADQAKWPTINFSD